MSYTVHKRNAQGDITLTYEGDLIERGDHYVCLRAIFQQASRDLGYMFLKQGDIFTEWFYDDRWYNVFQVTDKDTGDLKGYYCNLTRPAEIHDDYVAADDLDLDLFVKPSGETLLLDEEEYEALELTIAERQQVEAALTHLRQLVQQRARPFHDLR